MGSPGEQAKASQLNDLLVSTDVALTAALFQSASHEVCLPSGELSVLYDNAYCQ